MTSEIASSPFLSQARAASESVLVVRHADRAAIVLTGKDTIAWLNGMVTCDVAHVGADQARYGLLVEKKGRIVADLFVVASRAEEKERRLALAVPRELRDAVFAIFDHHLIMEDVELSTPSLAFYVAYGPKAGELASKLPLAFGGSLAPFDPFGHGAFVFAVPEPEIDAFEPALRSALEALSGVLGDEAGYEALRIEKGLPRFGVEVDATLYPQEAALEKIAVSFTKGCYLGQEVVYMLEHRGHPKRKLSALALEGDVLPEKGAAVKTDAGDVVGEIRSVTRGPISGGIRAIAMLKWANATVGTELRVEGHRAQVT